MLDEMALHPVLRCTAVSMLHCIATAVSQGHQQIHVQLCYRLLHLVPGSLHGPGHHGLPAMT